jgi:deoxyhypusine synthase
MGRTAFQGKNLAVACDIWEQMLKAKSTIFLGLAGAMVPAGMRALIVHMINHRLIDCLVSTGANLFHDCHEILGRPHWQGTPDVDDTELFREGIDRIYDVFALENEFRKTDDFIEKWVVQLDEGRPYSTREFLYFLGERLDQESREEGILTAAYRQKIPIYCPAIGDSSIGIAIATCRHKGISRLNFDLIQDVLETAEIVDKASETGVIYIGGGTPKNFIQQAEVTSTFINQKPAKGHKYAIQVTTDSPQWGGLSGCTFKEAQSWGKIALETRNVSLHADATLALPLLVTGVVERAEAWLSQRKRPEFVMDKSLKVHPA